MASEVAEAERLHQAARDHMRAARRHRRRAQECMQQLDALIAAAAQRGIQIRINTAQPQGGPSGHDREDREQRPQAAAGVEHTRA